MVILRKALSLPFYLTSWVFAFIGMGFCVLAEHIHDWEDEEDTDEQV